MEVFGSSLNFIRIRADSAARASDDGGYESRGQCAADSIVHAIRGFLPARPAVDEMTTPEVKTDHYRVRTPRRCSLPARPPDAKKPEDEPPA